jgi:hypothetical protein
MVRSSASITGGVWSISEIPLTVFSGFDALTSVFGPLSVPSETEAGERDLTLSRPSCTVAQLEIPKLSREAVRVNRSAFLIGYLLMVFPPVSFSCQPDMIKKVAMYSVYHLLSDMTERKRIMQEWMAG